MSIEHTTPGENELDIVQHQTEEPGNEEVSANKDRTTVEHNNNSSNQNNAGNDTIGFQRQKQKAAEQSLQTQFPLVSCIMPTGNRPAFVEQAVRMFRDQDYPFKELIIVYNNESDLPPMQYPNNVRFVQTKTKVLGAKRNEGCRYAQGAIMMHWDDDDIYNHDRIGRQVIPILTGEADMTGMTSFSFYEAVAGQTWKLTHEAFNSIFHNRVAGGSLAFNRHVWDHLANYPNVRIAEDVEFLKRALRRGVRLVPVDGRNCYMVVRHTANTWRFEENNFRTYSCWLQTELPEWAAFYANYYHSLALDPGLYEASLYQQYQGYGLAV
jgi:glycosyltransferase involved in cell wall biosynthesis